MRVESAAAARSVTQDQRELDETLAIFEEIDDLWGIGTTLHAMSRLRVVYDRYDGAGDLFERAVQAVERVGDSFGATLATANLAMARLAAGDTEAARTLMDDVMERRPPGRCGRLARTAPLTAWPVALERHERLLADLRAALGEEAFDVAYRRGVALL